MESPIELDRDATVALGRELRHRALEVTILRREDRDAQIVGPEHFEREVRTQMAEHGSMAVRDADAAASDPVAIESIDDFDGHLPPLGRRLSTEDEVARAECSRESVGLEAIGQQL